MKFVRKKKKCENIYENYTLVSGRSIIIERRVGIYAAHGLLPEIPVQSYKIS